MARHAWRKQGCVTCHGEAATGAKGKGDADLVQGEAAWGAVPLLTLICCSAQVTGLLHRAWPRDLPSHPFCSNTLVQLRMQGHAGRGYVQTLTLSQDAKGILMLESADKKPLDDATQSTACWLVLASSMTRQK